MEQATKTGHTPVASLIAALLGMTGSCILFAAYLAVPAIGIVSGVLSPAPVMAVRFRAGRLAAMISLAGTVAILAAYFGSHTALLYLVQCGAIALLTPELLLKKFGASRTITWITAANMGIVAVAVAGMFFAGGFDFHNAALAEIKKSAAQATMLYEQSGIKGEELEAIRKTMLSAADLASKLYPALITITCMILSAINLFVAKLLATRFGLPVVFGEIKDYRAPEHLIWLLIIAGFATLAPSALVSTPALNLLAILAVIYFFQGWGVVQTIIGRQTMAGMMRFVITALLIFQPYLTVVITILGIFDLWGDFRTQKQQENL